MLDTDIRDALVRATVSGSAQQPVPTIICFRQVRGTELFEEGQPLGNRQRICFASGAENQRTICATVKQPADSRGSGHYQPDHH